MTITTKPPKGLRILFVDDEPNIREIIRTELPRRGHQVTVCGDGLEAVGHLEQHAFDCMIVDLNMPGLNGIEVLSRARELAPDTEAIILTGKQSLETAIEALRLGAFDYLSKPYKLSTLAPVLQRVADKCQLKHDLRAARHRIARLEGKSDLIGASAPIQQVRRLIQKVAPTSSTVLIRGETGTGKELVARAVHDQSPRASQPFVTVNCGALPESLIESELFGHGKGAFTGADQKRAGLFEVADGGTLFLDELGELPRPIQAKLLRVLESGEVRRLGETQVFQVDVRVVCATHRDLEAMVRADEFREDLWFRVNMFEIPLPPLRQRPEDIAPLAEHLVRRFLPLREDVSAFTPAAITALESYAWPGNVRELANVIERGTILCDQLPIQPENLPARFATPQRLKALGPMT
ncbi:MAG TPA: sigma-54 dependent transcriptional regulator, partial [Pirellulaceae bacterium]